MNLRLALSVVSVGTLAYACGPSTRSDVSVDRATVAQQGVTLASMGGGMRPTNTIEKTLKRSPETLAMRFDVASEGADVRFQLHVVNTSAKNVEVTFPSGQAYDFIVVDSVGREVWRWAEGRAFTQSVQNKLLGKGKSLDVTERWSPARAGRFTAIAVLNRSGSPIEQKLAFEHR